MSINSAKEEEKIKRVIADIMNRDNRLHTSMQTVISKTRWPICDILKFGSAIQGCYSTLNQLRDGLDL